MGVTLKRRRMLASRSCTDAHARAPQSVAQDAHHQHGGDEVGDALAGPRMEQLGEREKEDEREQEIEEQHAAVAHGEPHVVTE